jgi:hypothetical protein
MFGVSCAATLPAQAFPPVANPDVIPGTEDTTASGNVLTNDTATGSGNGLTLMSVTTPAAGGTVAFDATGKVSYTPPADAAGVFSFSYVVREDDPTCLLIVPAPGACLATGSGTFEIAPVADAPILVVSNSNGPEGSSVPLSISATLQDTDGSQTTEETFVDGVPAGVVLSTGTDLGGGLWRIPTASLAGLTVTGPPDYNGTLNLNVSTRTVDEAPPLPSNELISGGTALTVQIAPVNDQPVVVGPAPTLNTSEDVNGSVSLLGVFDDVDIATNGDSLSYSVVSSTNPAVDVASMAGDVLSVTLLPNQFGTAFCPSPCSSACCSRCSGCRSCLRSRSNSR